MVEILGPGDDPSVINRSPNGKARHPSIDRKAQELRYYDRIQDSANEVIPPSTPASPSDEPKEEHTPWWDN